MEIRHMKDFTNAIDTRCDECGKAYATVASFHSPQSPNPEPTTICLGCLGKAASAIEHEQERRRFLKAGVSV